MPVLTGWGLRHRPPKLPMRSRTVVLGVEIWSFLLAVMRRTCLSAMQVVLPLLQNEVVATGWVSQADFLTGLALVQAMPGPLFNFAAYLGAPP